MADLDAVYGATKAAMLGMIGEQAEAWSTPVPATPAWTVFDVAAHVTGVAAENANRTVPDLNLLDQFRDPEVAAVRDGFADGQVIRRRGRSPAEVIEEWDAAEQVLRDRIRRGPSDPEGLPFGLDVVVVTDLCVHTDDVASALGRPTLRGSPASRVALAGYRFGVDYRFRTLGLPGLTLRYDGEERTLGEEPAGATLTADRWELLRVLAGRRSRSQILALDWTGDPEPYLPLLPAYGEREDPLVEG